MKTNKILGASILALSAVVAAPAMAQAPGAGGAAGAGGVGAGSASQGEHNWKNVGGEFWRDSSGKCWRDATWTAADAVAECDPELMPKPAPAPKPAAKPVAPRAAPKPVPPAKPPVAAKPKPARCDTKITLSADDSFAFGKTALSKKADNKLDAEVMAAVKACGKLEKVLITGHTDRIGTQLGNLKISEKRANAVKASLVKKGLPAGEIETMGMGKTMPIHTCPDTKNRKALIKCLAPNRRVEIEIKGLK